jgi:hypothetical protein
MSNARAVIVDLEEFRRRREARRQPSSSPDRPVVAYMPVIIWYPVWWAYWSGLGSVNGAGLYK